jgi:hypothetical protein
MLALSLLMQKQTLLVTILVTLLAGCEFSFDIQATVTPPPAAAGKAIVITSYEQPLFDARGLPMSRGETYSGNQRLVHASIAGSKPIVEIDGAFGAPENYYLMAWVDMDGSSAIAAPIAAADPNDSFAVSKIRALDTARPNAGDLVGVFGPHTFGRNESFQTTITLAPLTQ